MHPPNSNCWAEIDLGALAGNVGALRALGPDLMAVLKADAYGHGLEVVAPALAALNISHYGVATALEGAALRSIAGAGPNIYVMTATAPDDASLIVAQALTAFLSSRAQLAALDSAAGEAGTTVDVHIEVDTGIGRAGVLPEHVESLARAAATARHVRLGGICTHFTWGENPADAAGQHLLFERALAALAPGLLSGLVIHAANSPATLSIPGARYHLIRPGLLLYGIAPETSAAARPEWPASLRPVLRLRARVLLVRELPAGASISYGRTYTLPHRARIATIGIGYGDGYSRRLSNLGGVLLAGGIAAPVRGRVCMDQICVELPESAPALAAGDAVTLLGREGDSEIGAAQMAESIGATPHEITTCLSGRVPRIAVAG